uniref:Uncharacterized protein n=1 Tax=Cacopsylla melanoneura TaxID=428564 RepID=A0A8D9EYQ2_9HEMI
MFFLLSISLSSCLSMNLILSLSLSLNLFLLVSLFLPFSFFLAPSLGCFLGLGSFGCFLPPDLSVLSLLLFPSLFFGFFLVVVSFLSVDFSLPCFPFLSFPFFSPLFLSSLSAFTFFCCLVNSFTFCFKSMSFTFGSCVVEGVSLVVVLDTRSVVISIVVMLSVVFISSPLVQFFFKSSSLIFTMTPFCVGPDFVFKSVIFVLSLPWDCGFCFRICVDDDFKLKIFRFSNRERRFFERLSPMLAPGSLSAVAIRSIVFSKLFSSVYSLLLLDQMPSLASLLSTPSPGSSQVYLSSVLLLLTIL